MYNIHIDMETNDPDDYMMLLFLMSYPSINITGITVYPGTPEQVGLIRSTLKLFGMKVPIGASDIKDRGCYSRDKYQVRDNPEISDIHKRFIDFGPEDSDLYSSECLYNSNQLDAEILCGAPLTNIAQYINIYKHTKLNKLPLTVQGGFAGDNIATPLVKRFREKGNVWRTFNLNGDVNSADIVLKSDVFECKSFISKNITHACHYTKQTHKDLEPYIKSNTPLEFLHRCMGKYLETRNRKAFHDVLAAVCMIEPRVAEWREIQLYHKEKDGNVYWGSYISPDSNTYITIDYDKEMYFRFLTGRK